jgi:hypothetical protein
MYLMMTPSDCELSLKGLGLDLRTLGGAVPKTGG